MPNWKKLILSGSNASLNSLIVTSGVTGSLFGTSSWSQNTVTASYVNPLTQTVTITGSLVTTNAISINTNSTTDSIAGTDWLTISANGTTFGFSDNAPSGQGFMSVTNGTVTGFGAHVNNTDGMVFGSFNSYPLTLRTNNTNRLQINASGDITVSNNLTLTNGNVGATTATIGGALYTTSTSNAVSTNTTIFTISTVGTYTSGFIDYHVTDGSGNARSGQIQIAYVGGQVAHNETATQDIGNTSGFQWDVQMSGSDINLESIVTSGVWDIKLIAKVF